MPFDTIEEKDSMHIGEGVPVAELIEFLSQYKDAKVSIIDGFINIDYKRDETPTEKADRLERKEKASLRNKANYQKMKEDSKNKPASEKLEAVQRFNPLAGR